MEEVVYNVSVLSFSDKYQKADLIALPMSYELTMRINTSSSLTVPVIYAHQRLLSVKNLTFNAAPIGAFDDLQTISIGIWTGLLCVMGVLTMIDIIQKRVKRIPGSMMSFAAQKLFLYFGAILGKGFDIPSSLAIRFSVGVYLLIIVVFVNLFNGVLKANFSSQKKENINGIPDLLKVTDVNVYICPTIKDNVKESTDDEMKTFWQDTKKTPIIKQYLSSGKQIWFGDIPTLQLVFLMIFSESELKVLHFHLGSATYLQQALVLPVNNATMSPKALTYINRRLRTFVETGQATSFHRLFERDWHIELEPQHSTAENEVHILGFKDIKAKFRLWAAMLGVASFVFTVELLTRFQFLEPLNISRMKRKLLGM